MLTFDKRQLYIKIMRVILLFTVSVLDKVVLGAV
jgi:hypothetical protein